MTNAHPSPSPPDHSIPFTGPLPYHLTNDYLFHILFQENTHALQGLLSALLHVPAEIITEIRVINPIIAGQHINDKPIILNLLILLNHTKMINIEMQVLNMHDWPERSLTYLSRLADSLKAGETYANLTPVYQIGILNFPLFPEDPEKPLYAEYRMMETTTHRIYSDKFGINVLDLSYLDRSSPSSKDCSSSLYRWATLFRSDTWEELEQVAQEDPYMNDCVVTLKKLTAEEQLQQELWWHERYKSITGAAISYAQKEGQLKGSQDASRQTAWEMLRNQEPIEKIIQYSHLSREEIEELAAERIP